MKRNIFFTIYILFFSTHAFAWTMNADFEGCVVGEKAQGEKNILTQAFSNTKCTDKITNNNSKNAAKVGISAGSDGWGSWGGAMVFPAPLHEGDEVWFRAYFYLPADFDYSATGRGLKTMRIHTESAGKNNEGYLDILIANDSMNDAVPSGTLSIGSEVSSDIWKNGSKIIQKGRWQAIEMYAKFSSVAGEAKYRVWQDGKLVFKTSGYTLRSPTSQSNLAYIFTYWNGGAPKTQSAYIDDIVITNERPRQTDLQGNPMIGLIGGPSTISAPNPPLIQ